jgi:hypothetical protein
MGDSISNTLTIKKKNTKKLSMVRRKTEGERKHHFLSPADRWYQAERRGDICPVISCPDSGEPF